MNSNQKGKRGERLLAQVLTAAGFPARRGVQYQGGSESPDVLCPLLAHWHVEGKAVEQIRIKDWLAQVAADSAGKPWFIAWKRNHGPWLAVLKLDALLDLLRETLPQQTAAPAAGDWAIAPSAGHSAHRAGRCVVCGTDAGGFCGEQADPGSVSCYWPCYDGQRIAAWLAARDGLRAPADPPQNGPGGA